MVKAKDDALLRRWSFDRLGSHTAGNAQGIGGAWWFDGSAPLFGRGTKANRGADLAKHGSDSVPLESPTPDGLG